MKALFNSRLFFDWTCHFVSERRCWFGCWFQCRPEKRVERILHAHHYHIAEKKRKSENKQYEHRVVRARVVSICATAEEKSHDHGMDHEH